jgi:flagellar hook-associated protein 1 FlgK
MTDLLSIGSSAVRNSQLALSVVSNNIANVNTDGYVRQDLDLQEGLPTKNGLFYLGSGAIADGVRRSYDGQVESSLRISISDLNAQSPLIEHTERLINVFGNKNASLTPALASFFDSLRTLSVDASSEVLRDQVLNEGQTLAARFNGLATQLDSLDLETRKVAEDRVAQFNMLTEQLAGLMPVCKSHPTSQISQPVCWTVAIKYSGIWLKITRFLCANKPMARLR